MVEDALDGKIDLIITKSVSRFARNTVDSLSTIRRLKDNGTECYFEKKYIDIRFQGRTPDYHNVLAGTGGEPEHFGKLHMGHEETVCRRQGHGAVRKVPRL